MIDLMPRLKPRGLGMRARAQRDPVGRLHHMHGRNGVGAGHALSLIKSLSGPIAYADRLTPARRGETIDNDVPKGGILRNTLVAEQ